MRIFINFTTINTDVIIAYTPVLKQLNDLLKCGRVVLLFKVLLM